MSLDYSPSYIAFSARNFPLPTNQFRRFHQAISPYHHALFHHCWRSLGRSSRFAPRHSPPKGRCRCSIPRIGRRPHGGSWCRCALALPHYGIYGICAGDAPLAADTPRHACVQGGYCCLSSRCHHPSGLSRFQSEYRGLGTKTPRCSHLLLHRSQDLGMERGTHSQNPSQCGQGALDFTL